MPLSALRPNGDPDNHSAGGRLAKLAGWTPEQYDDLTDRMNLFSSPLGHWAGGRGQDRWKPREARVAAQAVRFLLRDRRVIYVGRRVATAFGHRTTPWFVWSFDETWGFLHATIPHTSGRSHFYNSTENRETAAKFLRTLAPNTCHLAGDC